MESLLCFLITSDQPQAASAQFYWSFNGGIETNPFVLLESTEVTSTGFLKDCGITAQAWSRRHAE